MSAKKARLLKAEKSTRKPPPERNGAKTKPTLEALIAAHIAQAGKDHEENQRLWKAADARFEEIGRMISGLACESRAMLSYTSASEQHEKRQDKRIRDLADSITELMQRVLTAEKLKRMVS